MLFALFYEYSIAEIFVKFKQYFLKSFWNRDAVVDAF